MFPFNTMMLAIRIRCAFLVPFRKRSRVRKYEIPPWDATSRTLLRELQDDDGFCHRFHALYAQQIAFLVTRKLEIITASQVQFFHDMYSLSQVLGSQHVLTCERISLCSKR